MSEPHATRAPALKGVRIIDFTRVLAGPYCTVMLSDLGAEVIKVENPAGGDESRQFKPPALAGESTYFMALNRNKKSVVLDLSTPAGKAAATRLADDADVVVENFRPGVMQRLGLDYATLSEHNPGLIYCAISGYGSSGPLATRPGLDPVIQAECGLMAMTGEPDGRPMRIGVSLVDATTGHFACQAILAALYERQTSGAGQRLEVSLFDTGVNMLVNFAASYLMAGVTPGRPGNGNLVSQPAGVYQAADGPFVLTCVGDNAFRRLCVEVLERPELVEDPRFIDNPSRLAHAVTLTHELDQQLHTLTRETWLARLRAASIPCGEVRTVKEALESAEFQAANLATTVDHPIAGQIRVLRSPLRMSATPLVDPCPAPTFGEHTDEVLTELGYDEVALAAFASDA
ncbi:MAG: CoA transferase [Chromatiales bacterium]|jgi:crotonobetainyl-CoA:carnitine CoA-transferase CaiB-like acyl-CoA transferase|nr:CoA transferase [Chromatiales bacterium]